MHRNVVDGSVRADEQLRAWESDVGHHREQGSHPTPGKPHDGRADVGGALVKGPIGSQGSQPRGQPRYASTHALVP